MQNSILEAISQLLRQSQIEYSPECTNFLAEFAFKYLKDLLYEANLVAYQSNKSEITEEIVDITIKNKSTQYKKTNIPEELIENINSQKLDFSNLSNYIDVSIPNSCQVKSTKHIGVDQFNKQQINIDLKQTKEEYQ